MAKFYAYENRKWWWWILYLNLAATKKSDPDTYAVLKDLILIVFNQEEDQSIGGHVW